ncbi:MAG: hypothetical protein KQI78_16275 [Deltaproteobacteria bacterium]|nr:hypothetical protein [Deltaproteobacteria bacterium]
MKCHPKSTAHLLRDLFDTVCHQMAILELKEGRFTINMPNSILANLFGQPADHLTCRPLDEFLSLDHHLYDWLHQRRSGSSSTPVFIFECRLRDRSPAPCVRIVVT